MVNGTQDKSQWIPYQYRNKWLPDLCEKANVRRFGVHGIRHLFASILADANRPLPEIQHMLRHKNLTTTQRYIRRLKKENREVLEALPNFGDSTRKSPPKVHQMQNRHLAEWAKCLLYMASPTGFEPVLPAWKAGVLDLTRRWGRIFFLSGGSCAIRTRDSLLKRQILYQLS